MPTEFICAYLVHVCHAFGYCYCNHPESDMGKIDIPAGYLKNVCYSTATSKRYCDLPPKNRDMVESEFEFQTFPNHHVKRLLVVSLVTCPRY
jgi:hypothetical protein